MTEAYVCDIVAKVDEAFSDAEANHSLTYKKEADNLRELGDSFPWLNRVSAVVRSTLCLLAYLLVDRAVYAFSHPFHFCK